MRAGFPLFAVVFAPQSFSWNSGMFPLVRSLDARTLEFAPVWERLQAKSWTVGNALRQWGIRRTGSHWNALVPGWDEARFLRALPRRTEPYPVHFIWGEFAAPRRAYRYRRKGARVVVSVHCSARRWDSVWLRPDGFAQADEVVEEVKVVKDSVGNTLQDGDTVTVIKDLKVKGSSLVI